MANMAKMGALGIMNLMGQAAQKKQAVKNSLTNPDMDELGGEDRSNPALGAQTPGSAASKEEGPKSKKEIAAIKSKSKPGMGGKTGLGNPNMKSNPKKKDSDGDYDGD